MEPAPFIEQLQGRVAGIPATAGLVALNLLIFAAMLLAGAGLWHAPNAVQLAWGANFGPATKDGEWWRLLTAMFLHFGLLHLAINMAALVEAGRFVERILGAGRFLLLYFGSGLAGNLLSLAVQGDRGISGGASGAVFGVFGALIVALWHERGTIHPGEFRWLFGGAGVLVCANILLGTFIPGIDNGAHVGGFAFGALAAIALHRGGSGGRRTALAVRGLAAGVLAACCAFLVGHLPAPSYDWSDEQSARHEIGRFIGEDAAISARWQDILERGRREGRSFEEMAANIETEVTDRYAASFEQLATIPLDPRAPSVHAMETLRSYAGARRDAARMVADALRAQDPERLRRGLDMARAAAPRTAMDTAGASAMIERDPNRSSPDAR